MNTFSLVINHTPWVPERVTAMRDMVDALATYPTGCVRSIFINDTDYRGTDWQQSKVQWALDQWRRSAERDTTHHVFMTDDLHIAPGFWDILQAMTACSGEHPIGLLSNHPKGPLVHGQGHHWYRTNSWLVGPAYVMPHAFLLSFLAWFDKKPDGSHLTPGTKAWANDDSSINEFISSCSSYTLHPLPTIIEHRYDIGSTVGHGDCHSRERLSWRAQRWTEGPPETFEWRSSETLSDIEAMKTTDFWTGAATSPLLGVGE